MHNKPVNTSRPTDPFRANRPLTLRAESLFGGHRTITIIHNGEPYCLRITANEKLILTK